MSGISVSIVFFRFLQIVGSLIYFAGVCIVASGALSHGANTFVADLVVARKFGITIIYLHD